MRHNVKLSYTDRKYGPGTFNSITVDAGSVPAGVSKAVRLFWEGLNRKQRNDVRRSGLKIEALAVKP